MSPSQPEIQARNGAAAAEQVPNGPAAAAILSAGAGCALLGVLALAGDASKAIAKVLNFYNPSGPLSGVTTLAILFWLGMWFGLAKRWGSKTVAIGKVTMAAFILLIIGILLTFPPFADLLQGK
jgi:hypothetical protein